MKILHVDTEKGWRGGEQQLFYLVKGLKEKGIESAIACRKGDELEKRCKEIGFTTIPLSGRQFEDIFRIGIVGKEFDIIHAHAAKAHTISALSKKFHQKPVIYTRRVDYLPKKNKVTALKYRLTDKVVAISKYVKEILEESIKIPTDKLSVIYDAEIEKNVDYEKVERIKKDLKGKPLIGTAAALTQQKNIPNFIEAAKILIKRYPEAKFVVAGEGKLRKELQSLIERLNLQKNFKLLGFKKDIQNYIKAFDIFVLPSDFEGLGSSILIAMFLKVPVVSTDAGGTKEVVIDGKTGILVPKKNPQALAEGILRLLKDEKLKEQVTSNAYSMVIDKFSVDKMVDAYIALYGEVIKSGKNLG
ncbi:glycosyltransferase family 4 protein [Desulfurobacterium thermolithotrophum]|uniref:glycosyltransferase family 4 protein n=1 Tax=Desulfurobacterium thermolithotrophum TaxID=64160 RepID=UPI0013D2D1E7|nr:glycosyltransferase family 4 protein [Desulfurobacterium thermolithotrophum]